MGKGLRHVCSNAGNPRPPGVTSNVPTNIPDFFTRRFHVHSLPLQHYAPNVVFYHLPCLKMVYMVRFKNITQTAVINILKTCILFRMLETAPKTFLLLMTLKQLVTTSNVTILTFWRPAKLRLVKVKETLFNQELQPAMNVNVGSENLLLYLENLFHPVTLQTISV